MATFQTLPGFRDFYPEEFAPRAHLFRLWRQAAHAFGFAEYDGPVLEPLDLYKAKSGDEIETQLFSFQDKGERMVALRPEMTPTVCRLVGARANALKRPIKWFSIAEFFRYERMQKGRGRCFTQFNADIFGEAGPQAEIELISLLIQCFTSFGLGPEDFMIRFSDRNLWLYYLESLGLDADKVRGVLQAIDKFEKEGETVFETYAKAHGALAPEVKEKIIAFVKVRSLEQLREVLSGISNDKLAARLADWQTVLTGLDAMGLSPFIQVDLGVVRGLAYYTGFVFEAFDRKGELRALAGGGRYNDLVEKLGGPALPAVGFAIGDMTFSLLLEQRGLTPKIVRAPDVYCVIGGEKEKLAAFPDIQALRSLGFYVEYPFKEGAFGKQFKTAAESGARVALIYGGDELAKGVVKIRDLKDRSEREVPKEVVVAEVQHLIAGE